MLLPSALSCDSAPSPAQPSRLPVGLFASPPASPPTLSSASQNAFGNIMTTCRSLQSLMTSQLPQEPTPSEPSSYPFPTLAQLPTPPMAHAPPPMKLRLRSRARASTPEHDAASSTRAPRRIVKRTHAAPSRGLNKRRRSVGDDQGRESGSDSDEQEHLSDDEHNHPSYTLQEPTPANSDEPDASPPPPAPSTPKRARIAPEHLPLGLERSDFHDVHRLETGGGGDGDDSSQAPLDTSDDWTAEDDRILVELVLEKLKLSKTEWQDCARNLGKDRHSLSRRWKSLMMNGDVGLKSKRSGGGGAASRRAKLHSTWR